MADPQPPQPPDTDKIDPLLESLLAKARPIIAEERGLNHRSRVKIQSIGKKMKIPAAVVDQALQLLHGAPPVQGSNASGETQYEKAFAKAMSKKIAEIPGNILTNKIEEKAISVGTRKYQLSETQARNIVRRVAEEVGVPRVSLTEAERHIEQEIAEAIGEATWVAGEVKTRLIRNAKRLGVTRDQANSMIQRHLQFNFKQVQFERKLTDRLWVVAACIVVGTGLSLFVYFQLQQARKESQPVTDIRDEDKDKKDPDKLDKETSSPDWWDDAIKLTLQKTRLKVAGFPVIHDQLKSRDQGTRSKAYQALFTLGIGKVNPQVIRQRIALVIPPLFRTDPSLDALAGMIRGFERSIKMPVGKIPTSKDFFTKAFWALDLLNQLVGDESMDDAKVVAIQQMIESITGRNFDLFLSAKSRLSKQKRALIEVYFRQMADVGNAFPAVAPESFEMLEEMAEEELSTEKLQNMRTLFLTATLKGNDDNWSHSSSLIKRTILAASSGEIAFFIDLMETTASESLQIFLEESLLERAGLGDDFESATELAARLREYFEIGMPAEVENTPALSESLNQILEQYNNKWSLAPSQLDNRRSAQLLIDSVYVTTLLAILGTDEEDSLEPLMKLGFPTLEDPRYLAALTGNEIEDESEMGPGDGGESTPNGGNQRFVRQRMNEALAQLNRYQILSPERRVAALNRVHSLAPLLTRLDGNQAAILAEYLFARKTPQEAQVLIESLPEFRRWPRLMLALADLLDQPSLPRQTCLDVSSLLLNEDILPDGSEWNKSLAEKLSNAAREQLVLEATKPSDKTKPDPVGTLKTLIEYFYRLRVRASLVSEKLPAKSDVQSSMEFLIAQRQTHFQKKNNTSALNEIRRRRDLVAVLGQDPLSRFQLKQQVLMVGLELDPERGDGSGEQPQIVGKLKRLVSVRFPKMESVIGQIAENEIRMLLNYYQQKLN